MSSSGMASFPTLEAIRPLRRIGGGKVPALPYEVRKTNGNLLLPREVVVNLITWVIDICPYEKFPFVCSFRSLLYPKNNLMDL